MTHPGIKPTGVNYKSYVQHAELQLLMHIDDVNTIIDEVERDWLETTPWDGIRNWVFYDEVRRRYHAKFDK